MIFYTLIQVAGGCIALGVVGIAIYVAAKIAHCWTLGVLAADPEPKAEGQKNPKRVWYAPWKVKKA